MRIYRVVFTVDGAETEKLVRAGNPAAALRLATERFCSVAVASQDDLIRMTRLGVELIEGMPDGSAPSDQDDC